jgi:hypothetical protein
MAIDIKTVTTSQLHKISHEFNNTFFYITHVGYMSSSHVSKPSSILLKYERAAIRSLI